MPRNKCASRDRSSISPRHDISSEEKGETMELKKEIFPETDLAQGIVGWDGQDDPNNPQNFSVGRKWCLLALISSITFVSPLASSMAAPAVDDMSQDLDVANQTLLAFSTTIYLLGYTFGPLFLAPLSELYGRRIVLSASNWFFVAWQLGCALAPNIASLIIFRFLAGIGGVGCVTLGGGVVADLFPVEQRGMATSIWSMGPLFGPVVGPIAGGFIGESIGWRWVYWILLIVSGALSTAVQIFNKETYAPIIIQRKTFRLAKEMQRPDLRNCYYTDTDIQRSATDVVLRGLRRPLILLVKSPIILFLATYLAFAYGLLFLFFTTITPVFRNQYGFSPGLAGLAYLGIGVGSFTGLYINAMTSDKIVVRLASRKGGKVEPEMRLPTMIGFSCLLPISFFWYGWAADKQVHWIVPIIGMIPFGTAIIGIFMPIQAYGIDCYPQFAASVIASITASRSLFGALLPLAGSKMFATLGLGWGNSLLGFLAVVFIPVPILFIRYGQTLREKYHVEL